MRAAVITRPSGPDVLEIRDVDAPRPGTGEVLVRVRGSALNRADVLQRQGRYPAPPGAPADIPGLEFAGEIAELGPNASRWRVGQRVFGLAAGGAHAELITAHERTLAELPDSLSWTDAGATPEAFITAHDALITQAQLRRGERLLIHAVGSGVGLAALQLARAIGAVPFGTSRTADKLERAREHGLEQGIALDDLASLAPAVAEWTGGLGMDVVLDLVGGPFAGASVATLALHGRLMLVGTVAGGRTELDLGRVLHNRLTIRGTVLRARGLEEKALATEAFTADVVPLLARGTVRPVIDSRFPLARTADAHARLESNATFGKVALGIPD
ncbi:MAG: NAD(P)H-quinone oxidoreductase [Gemmatimonadota bacterium]|nr:NAD(P)H-quinone oxidoreductase [Gemmatimonadota bacterium]